MVPLFLVAVAFAFAVIGIRQTRRQEDEKQAILTPCLGSFVDPRSWLAPDGYLRVFGRLGSRRCRLAIIPDTLALRRLPQLWLTVATSSPYPLPSLVITARPRGDDYVSNALNYARHIDVPSWLPRDTTVRVDDALVDLEPFREPIAALFDNPLVKELSLDPNGFRLVYRLAEGERANHLLLRQCRFTARVEPALLESLIAQLAAIESAIVEPLASAA